MTMYDYTFVLLTDNDTHVGHVQSPTIVLIGWNLGVCKASIM